MSWVLWRILSTFVSTHKWWFIGGAVAVAFLSGWRAHKYIIDAEAMRTERQIIEQKLDIREKQDAIRNAPIDTAVTIRRLHKASF